MGNCGAALLLQAPGVEHMPNRSRGNAASRRRGAAWRTFRLALVVLLAALGSCTSVQDGAILRFESVVFVDRTIHAVPFEDGSLLTVGYDHSVIWLPGPHGWEGRLAAGLVQPVPGQSVVIRTVWGEIGGTVTGTSPTMVETAEPLSPGMSGAGAWIDDHSIIGVVVAGAGTSVRLGEPQ